jgi:hypothetical protein
VYFYTPTTAVLGLGFAVAAAYGTVTGAPFVAAAGFFGSAASIFVAAWRARRRRGGIRG